MSVTRFKTGEMSKAREASDHPNHQIRVSTEFIFSKCHRDVASWLQSPASLRRRGREPRWRRAEGVSV